MKYMGSKVSMLAGTLGDRLQDRAPHATRFVDLFAGSGAVTRYVATRVAIPTVAVDLMRFSAVLTTATTARTGPLPAANLWSSWRREAECFLRAYPGLVEAAALLSQPATADDVHAGRLLCREPVEGAFIWRDYGGYYFSPKQALQLSAYYAALPNRAPHRTVALAALLRAASRASASPGHTAQPFRPTERLLPHVRSSWRVDIGSELERQVYAIAPVHAMAAGTARSQDSTEFAKRRLRDGDLVFCDPPYSEAQYSRFYHVLEGIAVGGWPAVFGAGRAPAGTERSSSAFSRKSMAKDAALELIDVLAEKRATVLWTYPEGERSNGLTVEMIRQHARRKFQLSEERIPMRHSTLGGSEVNHKFRAGRRELHEVLLTLTPLAA